MADNERINQFETSGIFEAVLKEDFIATVQETGLPYCNAFVAEFFQDNDEFPLTWVPFGFFMSFPLKEGDVIWVEFRGKDYRLPVMVGVKSCALLGGESIPAVWKNFAAPKGGTEVTPPEADTSTSFKFDIYSEDIYTIYLDDQVIQVISDTVIYKTVSGVFVFSNDDAMVYSQNVIAEGGTTVKALVGKSVAEITSSAVDVTAQNIGINALAGGKVTVGNPVDTVGGIIGQLIDILLAFDTVGSPAAHSTGPGAIAKLNMLKQILNQVLG